MQDSVDRRNERGRGAVTGSVARSGGFAEDGCRVAGMGGTAVCSFLLIYHRSDQIREMGGFIERHVELAAGALT